MAAVSVPDPIELAKELALEFDLRGDYREEMVDATLHVMNGHLHGVRADGLSIVKALEAYQLPVDNADIEFLPEEVIPQLKIDQVIARGRIDSILWFGSVSLSTFGLRMFGVEFYQPNRKPAEALFVPVEAVEVRLAT